ncbi:FAD/NAD(P)-binding protein [Hamadaea sp.]|uniref:FAD/NAD(P)-binding protein n=1 Tax=Hamadaea sp. TaxID=2024425 RepID=UPI0025C398ED|nr:FAD/NAD(P)-binding protein [Hamadaea sp.]
MTTTPYTMTPLRYRVVARRPDTADVVTLDLDPLGSPVQSWAPGQFTMVYAFGVGEVPLSVSGGEGHRIVHTVRSVGAVTAAICVAPVGTVLGVRGPFGHGWSLPDRGDLVLVGGGIGLAPLRPLVRTVMARRHRFGEVDLLVGARTPDDLLFTDEYDRWRESGISVHVIVDRAGRHWSGQVGVVTSLLDRLRLDPEITTSFLCGPEIMMRVIARNLTDRGLTAGQVQVSLERNMRCGYGVCGHCQYGPLMVCRDGPVTDYATAEPLMAVREL